MHNQIAALATDTGHIVMWDVDALLADCRSQPCRPVDTGRLIPRCWLTIDKVYAMTTDITAPILLFELPFDMLYIADGNHRLYRAAVEKAPQMNVIVIPQDVHLNYLFRSSPEVYRQVVEGLKDEGIFIRHIDDAHCNDTL